ncbi:MAG: hypothetical protein WKF83_10435 [Nocardioidaceae bacterium]
MSKLSVIVAAGAGYVLGSRAGRERYEQIKSQAQSVWSDPRVQQRKSQAADVARDKASEAASAARARATEAAAAAKEKAGSAAGSEPSNNEGPAARQPAPPQGI